MFREDKNCSFLFLMLLNTLCTKEVIIPKREQPSGLALFFPLICLLERSLCGGVLKCTHSTCGRSTSGAGSAETERGDPGLLNSCCYQPLGMHPCAQAIIVNDKVTIEVIIVLN